MDKGRYFEKGRVYLKTDTGSIPIDVLVIPTIAAPLHPSTNPATPLLEES